MEKIEKSNLQLQKNTHKYNFSLIMIFLTFFGCSNEIKETTYKYNSNEYHEKIKEFKISLNKAKRLPHAYILKKIRTRKSIVFL